MNPARRSTRPLAHFAFNQRHSLPKHVAGLFLLLVWWSSVLFAQSTTTISGTVYMPNGTLPLPGALVYVTTGAVTLPASGANCTSSSVTAAQGCITAATITPAVVTSGTGVYAYTTTAVDGTFTLNGVPEGNAYTLVIQSGKWLNQFAEPSSGVLSSSLSGLHLNMPSAHSATANIPLIAIQTASVDAMECVFRDLGLASTEFTDDSVVSGPSLGGRIHLYKGNGAEMSSTTPTYSSLLTQAKLNSYDMVMFPCEGTNPAGATATTIGYLINYAGLGGRLFATHYSDALIDTTTTGANGQYFYSAGGSSPTTWGSSTGSVTPDPGNALINTSFSDGNMLASWLYENGYSYGATAPNTGNEAKVEIGSLRFNVDTVNAPAQAWLTFPPQASQTYNVAYNNGSPIMQFSFNTPWGASADNQFGRVLYNEYHVEAVSETGSPVFPAECPTLSGAGQVPQEKMLEFAIFDLSAAVIPVVLPTASLAITTNPSNSIFNEGDTTDTISVDVTNTSSTIALPNNLTLAVTLPAGLTATAMADSSSGNWICTVGTLTCTNTSGIAANASDAISITVTVSGSAAGSNPSVTGPVSATLTSPNFSSNVTSPLTITVDRHAAVTWATPASIPVGTPLSSTQLNAVGNTAGTYVYTLTSPSGTVVTSGTVLPVGVNTLWVTFTPTDSTSYPGTATASVTLTVFSAAATAGNPVPVSFASEPVGSSTTQNVTFTFTGAGLTGTPLVVTQGATGLDFSDAGGGTCDTNGTSYAYSIGSTCTVAVTFAPLDPGLRYGAVLLKDASGNVLATAYLAGTGTGAQALFPPGTQTMLTPDVTTYWPEGMAVDSQFNVFFVDGNSNNYSGAVLELPWLGNSYGAVLSPGALTLPGLPNLPTGNLVEDGAGNLYVGMNNYATSSGNILKYPWNGSGYGAAISLGSDLIYPNGIAVDGAGNLFIADSAAQFIAELPWTGSSTNNGYGSQTTLANAAALGDSVQPHGVAVDSADNVFFLAATSGATAELMEIPYVSGSYSASFVTLDSTLTSPYGIVVDTNSNVYVADTNSPRTTTPVYEYVLNGGTYGARTQLFTTPRGGLGPMTVDGAGNLYMDWNSGDSGGALYKQNRNVLPEVVFPTTTVQGTADTTDNPLSFALLNYGNANLSLASEAFPTGNASFSFDGSTSCVHSGAGSLAANVSCSYAMDFTPASAGSIPGLLLLTDNNLNVSGATQSISLSGTATGPSSLTFTLPANTTLAGGIVGTVYSPVTFLATGGTAPNHYTLSGGALPAGMSLSLGGLLTGTPTAGGVFSITVLATDANSVTGAQTYTLTVLPPTITVTPSTLPAATIGAAYTQSFAAAGGTSPYTYALTGTLPTGLSLSAAGVLSGTPSVAGGPYTFTVTATDSSTGTGPYSGISATYSFTLAKLTATVALSNLAQTYTGLPLAATATTVPAGLAVALTYNDSSTPPTAPGSYTVVATINDGAYQGTTTGILIISKATAPVTLGNLAQTYTGSPLSATATTVPAGLAVTLTYNGSATPPTAPGSYTVVATINDAGYQGTTTGILIISKVTAPVTLGNLTQTYTGSPLSATATTVPAGLAVTFTYNGSATPPTAPGSYTVVATINDAGYQGSATGILIISKRTATVTLSNLNQTYTGSPLSATATTVPAGLTVALTYNGSGTPPIAGGSYAVVATITDTQFAGSATGTLTIAPLTPAVGLSSSSNPAITQTAVTFTASVSSSVGTPTGTVSFLDSSALLGQAPLSAGVATLTTSSLSDGSHSITAVYNGDTNFVTVASAALTESILDFSLTPGSGGGSGAGGGSGSTVTTQTAQPGGTATYPLNIVPSVGAIFPTPILLTVAGLPAGATAVITPSSWAQLTGTSWSFPANTPLPAISLTVQLAPASASAKQEHPATGRLPLLVWGVLLLPFAAGMRRGGKRLRGSILTLLLMVAGLGAVSALNGCSIGNGFFGKPQSSSYKVTVTATSGALTRSTTLTLNVE